MVLPVDLPSVEDLATGLRIPHAFVRLSPRAIADSIDDAIVPANSPHADVG